MRECTFLLVVVAVMIYAIGTPATGYGESFGNKQWHTEVYEGWEIKDINDHHIQELGGWAVSEFLKHVNYILKFNKVVSGEQKIVSGMHYKLDVNVSNITSGKLGNYTAEVYEEEWTKTRKLIYFHKAT